MRLKLITAGCWFALAGIEVTFVVNEANWWSFVFLFLSVLYIYWGVQDVRRYGELAIKERDNQRPTVPAYMLASALHESKREVEAKHGPGSWDVADVLDVVRQTGERQKR